MVDYDPYMDEILTDPYPVYERLRNESPVHYIEEYDCWFLSRFDVVWDTASDAKSFVTAKGTTPGHLLTHDTPPSMSLNAYDPPRHAKMRAQIKDHFTPKGLEWLREPLQHETDRILDAMQERGSGDLVEDLAARLSVTGACLVGGIPLEMRDQGIEWVNAIMHRREGHRGSTEVGAAAGKEMFFWCLDYVKQMRAHPERASGVLHTLLTRDIDGELLDDFAVASTLSLVLIGGTDTFPKALGATLYRLWQHPDQRARVVADPGLARDAFLEVLRLDTPTQMLGRTCVAETEVRGETIRPGQGVMFMWASANRDEREFDAPDRFDIDRHPRRMLAFGQGTHMCVGHHVAKMEAEIGLRSLLERAPDYEIVEADARRNRTEFVQGWMKLPAKLG